VTPTKEAQFDLCAVLFYHTACTRNTYFD